MFASTTKPSQLLFTLVLGFIFALLSVSALPTPAPLAMAAPAPVAAPMAASNPASLLGRVYRASNPNVARDISSTSPIILRAADTGSPLINRAERFQLRMDRARRMATGDETA